MYSKAEIKTSDCLCKNCKRTKRNIVELYVESMHSKSTGNFFAVAQSVVFKFRLISNKFKLDSSV